MRNAALAGRAQHWCSNVRGALVRQCARSAVAACFDLFNDPEVFSPFDVQAIVIHRRSSVGIQKGSRKESQRIFFFS